MRCLDRRARWLEETVGQKRPTTEVTQGGPEAVRQKVETARPSSADDDEEMATAEAVSHGQQDTKMDEVIEATDMDESVMTGKKREREEDEGEVAKEEV